MKSEIREFKTGDDGGKTDKPKHDPKALVQSDLAALSSGSDWAYSIYNIEKNGVFKKVFGGTTNADVKKYLDARIRHFYTMDDFRSMETEPARFQYSDWQKSDQAQVDPDAEKSSKKAVMGAANIGTLLWLQGAINGVQVKLKKGSEMLPIESSRVGIMLFGEGYAPTIAVSDSREITAPVAFRHGILVHEARHSDCTGGLPRKDIMAARQARNSREFDETFGARTCGHLHVKCPPGHDLAGLAACDKEAFGAYAVGAIFESAAARGLYGTDKAIMDIVAMNSWARVLVDKDEVVNERHGAPDMSHAGVKD